MMLFAGIFLLCLLLFCVYRARTKRQHKLYEMKTECVPLEHEELLQKAAEIAASYPITNATLRMRLLKRHLNQQARVIRRAYLACFAKAQAGEELFGPEEWLADNYYIADERIKLMQQLLSCKRMKDIPFVADGPYKGTPRIYVTVLEWVSSTNGCMDQDKLTDFLQQYQQFHYFTDDEVWLISTMLELALLEHLALYCKGVNEQPNAIPIGDVFKGLREVVQIDFDELFERLSQVEAMLWQDPSGVYENMDEKTRREYRKQVYRLAKAHKLDQVAVARKALLQAKAEPDTSRKHIGFALFEGELAQPLKRIEKRKQLCYVAFNVLLSFGISLLAVRRFQLQGWLKNVALFCLVLIPASGFSLHVVQFLFAKISVVRHIHRLKPTEQMVEQNKTLVVISTLLTSAKQAEEMVSKLELYYLANRFEHLSFGLLGDYRDDKQQKQKADDDILQAATQAVERLNKQYGNRFFLFQRGRTYNKWDDNYRGWERKRGAIFQLSKLLCDGKDDAFQAVVGDRQRLFNTEYVITLDGDTRLVMESAGELVGAMAHPLNQPVIKGGRVVSGYGILQPRMDVNIQSANKTWFSKIFAGAGGSDVYSGAVSDVYQDVFGEGIYTGKGIFHVRTFVDVLARQIPENTVLSHDLLEGSYVRCGLISDVTFTDSFPSQYRAYAMRHHRWLRGDWQLIPWLFSKVKDASGKRVKNPLNLLSKWKMLDNIRRSLTPVFLLLISILCFRVLPGSAWRWMLFVFAVLGASMLTATIDWVANGQFLFIREKKPRSVITGLRGALYQFLFTLACLPHNAWLTIDASLRSLFRMTLSRQRMLEWITAEDASRQLSDSAFCYYRLMWFNILCAFLVLASGGLGLLQVFMAALWLTAPTVCHWTGKTIAQKKPRTWEEHHAFLTDLSQRTWNYFFDFWRPQDNYLVPDNYQVSPANGLARRTSPTNIGIQLIAALCAVDLGLIDQQQMLELVDKTLTTMEKMERWNGHFYNWYDTETLAVLQPNYISTVDSGNLLSFFITLEQGVKECEGDFARNVERRIATMIEQMDFSCLYDTKNDLFYTGYHVGKQKHTHTHYDLMASEARLASYIAVARGEVPKKHWSRLSRTMVSRNGHKGLVSWTGTMFEYLMPLLLLPNIAHTLMDETYRFAVQRQKAAGRRAGIPWGASESGYFAFDADLNYQYQAFGCPDLALKRGQERQSVVTPYASVMALMVDFDGAASNLKQLKESNMYGKYGFYEAADYTTKRIPLGQKVGIVQSYMVHHLGMSLLALNNVLNQNVLQNRFMRNRQVRSAMELLEERIPINVTVTARKKEAVKPPAKPDERTQQYQYSVPELDVQNPRCHLVSGNRYGVMLTDGGIGYSQYRNLFLTRFRSDVQTGLYGTFIYLKNKQTGETFSNTLAPCFKEAERYTTHFYANVTEFVRKDESGIETVTEVAVSPEDDVEIRKVTLTNHTQTDVTMEITTYCELLLTGLKNDEAHPAFSNLFVETEFDAETQTLLAARRPREAGQVTRCAMTNVCGLTGEVKQLSFQTDRALFVGRNGSVSSPQALHQPEQKGKVGAVIDPIFSLRFEIPVPKGKSVSFALCMAYCESKQEGIDLSRKYSSAQQVIDALEQADMRGKMEFNFLDMSGSMLKHSCNLLPQLLYQNHRRRALTNDITKNCLAQPDLWTHSISGDLPVVLAPIREQNDLEALGEFLVLHHFWRRKGLYVDLVVICEEEESYETPLMHSIRDVVERSHLKDHFKQNGGLFVVQPTEENNALICLLYTIAKAVVGMDWEPERPPEKPQKKEFPTPPKQQLKPANLQFFNGYGGYDGDEYVIELKEGVHTPLPWSNVVSNAEFGFIATESGGGCVWQGNSHENRLTPWTNDTVTDPPQQSIYLSDGTYFWNTTPAPLRTDSDYRTRFGFGYCVYETICADIHSTHTLFVDSDQPIQYGLIELHNTGQQQKELVITNYVNPLMGDLAKNTAPYLTTAWEAPFMAVRNKYRTNYKDQTLYLGWSEQTESYTGNRVNFFGNARGTDVPDSVVAGKLCGDTGAGVQACMAHQSKVTLAPGQTHTIVVALSTTKQVEFQPEQCKQKLELVKQNWNKILGQVRVTTPDPAFDQLMNGWLLYQTIACRMMGRTAFYQSGGAFGFRDQLQDCLSVLHTRPDLARAHILRCCAHQFEEGDVQHWWHQTSDNEPLQANPGVRTRFSDDLLWLPYVTAAYVKTTGDYDILNEQVPFITSEPLREGEDERYFCPELSEQTATVYEHCLRSINRSMRLGEHGLPLMGSGDWNDGMSTVGNKGRGESVWMAWFLYDVMQAVAPLCEQMSDEQNKQTFLDHAESLKKRANENAWDGKWYRRAYFDDGRALGTKENDECQIDGISQSWSVISGAGRSDYQKQAMQSAMECLVDKNAGIIKLLTPPFHTSDLEPGYIKGYVPGVRENGGQYTHSAAWLVMAYAMMGQHDTALELFSMINPIYHTDAKEKVERYQAEPYVIAADVYSAPPNTGRGGWTWYTGSCGWMYQVGLKCLLGIRKEGNKLICEPRLPKDWKEYCVEYTFGSSVYRIHVTGNNKIEIDLLDDGKEHVVKV